MVTVTCDRCKQTVDRDNVWRRHVTFYRTRGGAGNHLRAVSVADEDYCEACARALTEELQVRQGLTPNSQPGPYKARKRG